MGIVGQGDWAGGIFRAPGGPDGTVYDVVNALVTDDRDLFKRGGTAFKASDISQASPILFDGYLSAGLRTVSIGSHLKVLAADDTTWVDPGALPGTRRGRPVVVNGMLAIPVDTATNGYYIYAGSRKASGTSAGTIGITNGSTSVTGSGTSWLANADEGMLLKFAASNRPFGVVAKVNSDTSLTLADPWTGTTAASAGYSLNPLILGALIPGVPWAAATDPLYLGVAGRRLLVAFGSRVNFSVLGDPSTFIATDYHVLPEGAQVIGCSSFGDEVLLFTTRGVWAITNMDYDLTDDAGNVQQQVSKVNPDVRLWGELGLAGWAGELLVPALDDVHLFARDGTRGPISEGIRPLYRSYVKAGYAPGVASVHRGHYLLPIMNGATVIDVLVCRLDLRDSRGNMRPAWTRWADHAMAGAFAERVPGVGAPLLLATKGTRLLDVSGAFVPVAGNKQDADGTTFNIDWTTRDFDTGSGNRNTVVAAKLRYELVDAASDDPTIAASYSTGPEGAAFTALSGTAPENDGTDPKVWRFVKRTRRIRLRFTSSGPSANLKVRVLELLVRSSSRL